MTARRCVLSPWVTYTILLIFILYSMLILIAEANNTLVKPSHYSRPPTLDDFYVELDLPSNFYAGGFNNVTLHLYNFKTSNSNEVSLVLGSTSASFSIPVDQPTNRRLCHDQYGSIFATFRTQGTHIEFLVQDLENVVIPYIQVTCYLNLYDRSFETTDNALDSLEVKQGATTFTFTPHPPTLEIQYQGIFLNESISYVPGGLEATMAFHVNTASRIQIEFDEISFGTLSKANFKSPLGWMNYDSDDDDTKSYRPLYSPHLLSNDFYGAWPYVDQISESYISSFHPINSKFFIAQSNSASTSSHFCFFFSSTDLTTPDTVSALPQAGYDWSSLATQYSRSGFWVNPDDSFTSRLILTFNAPGTHLCRMFIPSAISGQYSLRIAPDVLGTLTKLAEKKITFQILTQNYAVALPYWYITNITPTSLSINYNLPAFKRGDLVLLSKSYEHLINPDDGNTSAAYLDLISGLSLPFIVDQSIPAPTPSACIPFSYNRTHIAWSYLPTSFTNVGSKLYAKPMTCTINLHLLPGQYQRLTSLVMSVIPRDNVPYIVSQGYEAIRAYGDIYSVLDIQGSNLLTQTTPVRIQSANIQHSHFYSFTSQHYISPLTIRDFTTGSSDSTSPMMSNSFLNNSNIFTNRLHFRKTTLSSVDKLYQLHNSHLALFEDSLTSTSPLSAPSSSPLDYQAIKLNSQTISTSLQSDDGNAGFAVDRQEGYRLLTLSVKPYGMGISGGSLWNTTANTILHQQFADFSNGSSSDSDFQPPSQSSTFPVQPLHLVLDLSHSWIEQVTGNVAGQSASMIPIDVKCYYVRNGQAESLIVAWGKSHLYSHVQPISTPLLHRHLFIQLPAAVPDQLITMRCQIPLPSYQLKYSSSRIGYYLQTGTVLETLSVALYNQYSSSSSSSSSSSDNNSQQYRSDQDIISNAVTIYPNESLRDTLSRTNLNFDDIVGKPIEGLELNNIVFFIDYGMNNTSTNTDRLNKLRQAGFGDCIIPVHDLVRLEPSNNNVIYDIPIPTFPALLSPAEQTLTRVAPVSTPTSSVSFFTFALRGEMRTNSPQQYEQILSTFIRILTTKISLQWNGGDSNNDILLESVSPLFGVFASLTSSFPTRNTNLDPIAPLFNPPVPLNGVDGTVDMIVMPTRLLVTFAILPSTPTTTKFSPQTITPTIFQEFTAAWHDQFISGAIAFNIDAHTGYLINGDVTLSASPPSLTVYSDCLFKSGIYSSDESGSLDSNTRTTSPRTDFICGGVCDLLCPNSYPCLRHSDCFHGNCDQNGICGAGVEFNFVMDPSAALSQSLSKMPILFLSFFAFLSLFF